MNDNLIPRRSYSNIDLERLLKSKALGRTGKIMDLVSQRLLQDEKNVNAMEVKETAKSPERIFGDLICQLLGGNSWLWNKGSSQNRGATNFGKSKDQAKPREMQNSPYTN